MVKAPLLTIILLVSFIGLHAQGENSAPVVWERYKISDKNLSVLFPKMPIKLVTWGSTCGETQTSAYYAYAEEAAYELRITSKEKPKVVLPNCPKNPVFGMETLEARLNEIRTKANVTETMSSTHPQWYKLTAKNHTRWILSDITENDRWIELAVTHYPDDSPDFERFLGSLEFSARSGKEIGEGSALTLGDPAKDAVTVVEPPVRTDTKLTGEGTASTTAKPADVVPMIRVVMAKAIYTEAARKANVQGAVRLKVTFLATGTVGAVTPLTELPHGMTEQAIYAVRRIVFLPKKVNKVPVNVVQQMEYTFSIY